MRSRTQYFQNCLGVFQGGGCKGSAYVGAFKEALSWGVSFSEVVGTSAGSIVAVLIAAGADANQLKDIVSELDFNRFLRPPIRLQKYQQPRYSGLLKYIPNEFIKKYHSIFTHLGMYNSEELKIWLDGHLKKLLPHVKNSIRFENLIIPTKVVATNLITKSVEVYSSEKTPSMEVSEAVRNSCNIPFFFQPIDMRYVDGGLLSNLPSFVFDDHSYKLYNRILAFSLESDHLEDELDNFLSFSKALLNTTLEGNLELQLALQSDLNIISIKTGSISATDFEKINKDTIKFLIAQGEKATREFFRNETIRINSKINRSDISTHKSNTYNFLTNTTGYSYSEILVADTGTEWAYELFPTIFEWVRLKASVTIVLNEQSNKSPHIAFRQRLLKFLGASVMLVDDLPFRGIIFDGEIPEKCRAVIFNMSEDIEFHSKLYSSELDFFAISCMRDCLMSKLPTLPKIESDIKLETVDYNELLAKLKNIKQYNKHDVQMTIQRISVSEVTFITKYVLGYKYRQIHSMFDAYNRHGVEPFLPARILNTKTQDSTLVTPPIIEKHGDYLFVVEGNTRFTYAYRHNIPYLYCVVIENVNEPLASNDKYTAKEMLLADKPMSGKDRYENFDYSAYRAIESAVRNPNTCLMP